VRNFTKKLQLRKIFIILTFVISPFLFGQEKSEANSNHEKLESVINDIKQIDILQWKTENEYNSFYNDLLYAKLKENSNESQILDLIKTDNGILKMYLFRILCEKYKEKCFNILKENLNNYTKLKNASGCLIGNDYVTDFWIFYVSSNGWKSEFKININQKNELDSILISDKSIKLRSRYYAIEEIKTNNENYNLIKKLVQHEKNGIALSLLAKYKKTEDIKLIASFFNKKGYQNSFLSAVEKFPDKSFYHLVLKNINIQKKKNEFDSSVEWSYIFRALSKYPSQQTNDIFEIMLQEKDKHIKKILEKSIYLAITKNPNPIFEKIKEKIYLTDEDIEEIKIDIEIYDF
jgi:hypothetical protein